MLTSSQIQKASRSLGQLGYNSFVDRHPSSQGSYQPPKSEEQGVEVRLKLMTDERTGENRYIRVDEQGNRLE